MSYNLPSPEYPFGSNSANLEELTLDERFIHTLSVSYSLSKDCLRLCSLPLDEFTPRCVPLLHYRQEINNFVSLSDCSPDRALETTLKQQNFPCSDGYCTYLGRYSHSAFTYGPKLILYEVSKDLTDPRFYYCYVKSVEGISEEGTQFLGNHSLKYPLVLNIDQKNIVCRGIEWAQDWGFETFLSLANDEGYGQIISSDSNFPSQIAVWLEELPPLVMDKPQPLNPQGQHSLEMHRQHEKRLLQLRAEEFAFTTECTQIIERVKRCRASDRMPYTESFHLPRRKLNVHKDPETLIQEEILEKNIQRITLEHLKMLDSSD